jgi:hypothetical protein
MVTRFSAQFVWFLAAACTVEPERSQINQKTVQRQVAADVARVCGLPADERQSEIERIRVTEGIAIVCTHD